MALRRSHAFALGALSALSLLSINALALSQPDGTVIPQTEALKSYLTAEGESIEPLVSSAVTPETFDPSCNLTFTVIARGGGQLNSFGWYNVTGQKPDPSDLHEFLGCNDGVGTSKQLQIKSDPAYKGGKIGFFMATTEGAVGNCVSFKPEGGIADASTLGYLYYSENQYNDDNVVANGFIHLVILDSGVYPKAFYFGWEDLYAGGDNDFEDLLTRVEGITCAGGGEACDTGLPGICATGVMQCHDGLLACMGQSAPGAESCNGVDDDCDGQVDNGDLCADGKVCFEGTCVGKCGSGEFKCPSSLVCDSESGFCMDPLCQGKSCPSGSVCRAGECKAPCEGVTCPVGLVCRQDVCVDPCAGVACDDDAVCDQGVCREKCSCGGCTAGLTCLPSGVCVPSSCAGVDCAEGTRCEQGTCVDACQGVVCPGGQVCQTGKCVIDDSEAGGAAGAAGSDNAIIGGSGGASGSAGSSGTSGGKGGSSGSAGGDAGSGGVGGKGVASNTSDAGDDDDSGCGCRSVGGGPLSMAWAGALGAGVVLAAARRRRR